MAEPDYQPIAVTDLLLNGENPRIEEASSQRDILSALLDREERKIEVLAKHITEHGGVNPSELPIVVKDKGKQYTVLEGNRRLAALKILGNPDLAEGYSIEKKMREHAKNANLPTTLLCLVADSEEDARPWIEIRHTGENNGAGIVPWDSYMRTRWEQHTGKSHDSNALLVAEMASSLYPDDKSLMADLATVVQTRFTNLSRLASDPDVRAALGIQIKDGQVLLNVKPNRAKPAIKRVMKDLASEAGSVKNLYYKDDRRRYLEAIGSVLPDGEKDALKEPIEVKGAQVPAAARPPATTRNRAPKPKVLKGFKLDNAGHKTQNILRELQGMDLQKTPNSAAVLCRVLVELLVEDAVKDAGWLREKDKKLKDRLNTCVHRIDPGGKDSRFTAVRAGLKDRNHWMSINTLHQFVHNKNFNPTPETIVDIMENYRPLLTELDSHIKPEA